MSSEAVLFAILFTLIVPVVLALFAWILMNLVKLTQLVTVLQAAQTAYELRLTKLEDRVFPPYRSHSD